MATLERTLDRFTCEPLTKVNGVEEHELVDDEVQTYANMPLTKLEPVSVTLIFVFTFGLVFTAILLSTGVGDVRFTVNVTVPPTDSVCEDDGVIEVSVKPDGAVQDRVFVPTA